MIILPVQNAYPVKRFKPHCPTRKGPCYRPNCERDECRDLYYWSILARLRLGIIELPEIPIWFLTLVAADPSEIIQSEDQIKEFQKKVTKFMKDLSALARKAHVKLEYFLVYGVKDHFRTRSPYQVHVHLMITWIPHPTPEDQDPYTSSEVEGLADSLGLRIWIEKARDMNKVAGYLVDNVRDLGDAHLNGNIELPYGFHRFSKSQGWPLLEFEKIRREKSRKGRELRLASMQQDNPPTSEASTATVLKPHFNFHVIRHPSRSVARPHLIKLQQPAKTPHITPAPVVNITSALFSLTPTARCSDSASPVHENITGSSAFLKSAVTEPIIRHTWLFQKTRHNRVIKRHGCIHFEFTGTGHKAIWKRAYIHPQAADIRITDRVMVHRQIRNRCRSP